MKVIEKLIGYGADVNKATNKGNTVMHMVMMNLDNYSTDDIPDLLSLLRAGSNLCKKNHDGLVPLLTYRVQEWSSRPSRFNVAILESFIGEGMDINACDGSDPEGNSLIHLAFEASRRKNPKEAMEYVLSIAKLDIPPTDRNAKGQSVLHLASAEFIEDSNYERGQEHWIDFVLKSPVFACIDINKKDKEGATPLHVAASCSEFNVARLLRAGADPTLLTNEGMSALHVACLARQPGTVGLLLSEYKKRGILDQHINLCMTDARQRSPLHYACRSGHQESVRYLLANGADPTQRDCDGFTPLHALAEFPQEQELWSSGGIDSRGMASFQEDSRPTLENWNIFQSNRAAEIVRLLDKAGADLEAKTKKGDPPVAPMDLAIESDLETMAVELIRCGITPRQGTDVQLMHEKRIRSVVQDLTSITDPENIITAVQTHLKDGNIDAVEQLFSDCSNGDGMTLCRFRPQYFHAMVRNGHTRLLERFKEEAYHVDHSKENIKDECSPCIERDEAFTLLASACGCREPNLHVIKTLIEVVGVDVNAVSNRLDNRSKTDWATALHVLACGSYFWQVEALEYLLKQGADISDHPNGFWKEHTIQTLLERGSDPMAVDDRSMTCLEHVDDSKIARLLIQHGADILHVGVFSNALSRAVNRMDPLLVELFIENGVDVRNLKLDEYCGQNNILQVAAKRRYDMDIGAAGWEARQLSVIKLLLSRGADPFLAYSDSTTILQAVIERHGIVSPFFELDGLDMERRGRDERTLLVSACVPSVPESPYEEEPVSVHWEAAFLALERGANPNARDALGRTALHWLCTMKVPFDDSHEKLMAALIDAGPCVVHRHDKAGATPLHLALQSFQTSAIHALIERGAAPAESDPQGDTVLHHCARNMTGRKHIASPASDLFRLFLDKGLNINGRNGRGETPLHTFMASGWGAEERRRQMRPVSVSMSSRGEEGYDVDDERDEKGVVMHTNAAALAVFHDAQADWFCIDDENGSSLLHVIASRKGQSPGWDIDELVDTFKILLRDVGLDPRLEDKRLRTPVDMAVARERWDIVNLFGEGAEGKGDGFISGPDFSSDDE
ncbi:ankyrin repeat-containing domain protein [Apiospora arundinis]